MINLPTLKILLLLSSFLAINTTPAIAQITPDNTLGAESSRVVPNGAIDKIEGGALRDKNLFHSFKEFNINNGQKVYFNSPSGIENILTRVTGGNASNIFGTLGVDGAANLFLINPNGIVFGENARLDLGGSFVGTTANGLRFGEQGDFSATNPQAPGLLTVNPNALFFNQVKAASIEHNSDSAYKGLQVVNGNNLYLVGGDININGGKLYASGGKVELGGVAGKGTVELSGSGSNFNLTIPDGVEKSNIMFTNSAGVNVSAGDINISTNNLKVENGGRISASTSAEGKRGNLTVEAQDVQLIGTSKDGQYVSGLYTTQASRDSTEYGGNLTIKTNNLLVKNGAQVNAFIYGKGGNITVDAKNVQLIGESKFPALPSASRLHTSIVNWDSQYAEQVSSDSTEDIGNIAINTNSLLVKDGAYVSAVTFGGNKGGNLTVDAQDVQLIGETENLGTNPSIGNIGSGSGLYTQAQSASTGDTGDLTIKTNSLLVKDGARVSTSTFGSSESGNLTVDAQDVQLIGRSKSPKYYSGLFASTNGSGDAGNITIKTDSLLAKDGAQMNASTFSSGEGGDLVVEAQDIQLIGISKNPKLGDYIKQTGGFDIQFRSGLYTQAQAPLTSTGSAGNLTIKTNNLLVKDGAQVNASTFSGGNGGNLTVEAQNVQLIGGSKNAQLLNSLYTQHLKWLDELNTQFGFDVFRQYGNLYPQFHSGLYTQAADEYSTGNAGSLKIKTDTLRLEDGAKVSVESLGTERAGNIEITANSVQFGESSILATTQSTNGGNINLKIADLLIMRNGSQISTTAGNQQFGGNGGNITINSPFIAAVPQENSDITANAFSGDGGNVDITTQGIFGITPRSQVTDKSDITASSETGIQGEISITDPNVNPTQGVIELPEGLVDKSNQIAQICPRGVNAKQLSEFYITGKGSLPPNPLNLLEATVDLSRLATLDGEIRGGRGGREGRGGRIYKESKQIVEAQGFMKTENGEIYLVAQAPSTTPSSNTTASACSTSES